MADSDVLNEALKRIERKMDTLIEDVSAPPRNGQQGGLLFRMEKAEGEGAELRTLIGELAQRVTALEVAPGKAALSWWDRVGLALLGLTLTGLAGMVGAQLGRATPTGH